MPLGVRLVAWARTIRWLGWGFGEALIPLFLFSFSESYGEAGLLKASFQIALLLSLSMAGLLADRMSAKVLIIAGLILYPLVGFGYLFAGMWGAVLWIVAAQFFNGVAWALESIGVDTYLRRSAHRIKLASTFGLLDTITNFGWIVGALIGIVLVSFIPIHWLLFLIAPTSLIALVIVLFVPKEKVHHKYDKQRLPSFFRAYNATIREWGSWNTRLKLLGLLVLLTSVVGAITGFFIPIDAYQKGADPALVIILAIIAAIPALFGYSLGTIADKKNKHHVIAIGLVTLAITLAGVAFFPQYAVMLLGVFVLGVVVEAFYVTQNALITTLGPAETYGRRCGTFKTITALGDMAAPLALGVALDMLGFSQVVLIVAGIAAVLCIAFFLSGSGKTSRYL